MKKCLQTIIIIIYGVAMTIGALHIDDVSGRYLDQKIVSDSDNLNLWKRGRIIYKDKIYQYKCDIQTYLLMGVDSMDEVSYKSGSTNGGQTDALFLLIVDQKEKKWSVLAINRNTMTNVDIYNENGRKMRSVWAQICVQHGFGDGMEASCQRTESKVSETLFNLPIDGYMAINMGALPIMNDALGGVTVDAMDTIEIPDVGVSIEKGQNITLHGMEAWGYLVWRDESQMDSATRRLERQQQYIKAAYTQITSSDVDKITLLKETVNVVNKYTVMDMPVLQVAGQIMSYGGNMDQMYSLPGTETVGEKFVEYNMDEDAALDMLLSIYYEQIKE